MSVIISAYAEEIFVLFVLGVIFALLREEEFS